MKFCLDSRLSPKYLKAANQIRVQYRDIKSLPQIMEDYPEAEYVIQVPSKVEEETLRRLDKNRIILSYDYFPIGNFDKSFRFFVRYPVESFYEANALIEQGAEAIYVGPPLFFLLDELAALDTQIRLFVNEPYYSSIPRKNGFCGQWIRPEDLHYYETLKNAVVEFNGCRTQEEEALYRIYAEEHNFPGPISYIIHNIGSEALNRLMPENIGKARLNCGQRCQKPTGTCRICPNAFRLANLMEAKNEQH